jgi:hypothetical protein
LPKGYIVRVEGLALLHGGLGVGDVGIDLDLLGLDVLDALLGLQASLFERQFALGLHSGKGKLMLLVGAVLEKFKDFWQAPHKEAD